MFTILSSAEGSGTSEPGGRGRRGSAVGKEETACGRRGRMGEGGLGDLTQWVEPPKYLTVSAEAPHVPDLS